MKTLIFSPLWGRPEIVKIFLQGYERIRDRACLLCILSPEDPHRKELLKMLTPGVEICEFSNRSLGEKKNLGLKYALENFEFDYIMELGSDNLVNPRLFDFYRPYMERLVPFFGLNNIYITEWKTGKTVFIKDYNSGQSYGAGRMLLREAIICPLWPDQAGRGLDTLARNKLAQAGIFETVLDCGEIPYILDIKTGENLSKFSMLEPWRAKYVNPTELAEAFGYG